MDTHSRGIGPALPLASPKSWVYIEIQTRSGSILLSLAIGAVFGVVSGGVVSSEIDH
ncbi:hypothetical protein TGAMA5MH_00444 [Trichoderma gamsii]|uniref:Uncharacterized protein n=1 Tax=Trichoderma gamsii TaxID=398673 RepID=A0A2K0TSP0_9HYPO|nr:hypothetical protein TGAMA5MH_00444 [Trichoderma gamsii]